MMKKNGFYLALIIVYLLFLTKDNIIRAVNNESKINDYICSIENETKESEYQELLKLTNIENNSLNMSYSKVIKRDIFDFFNKITINSGYHDGVKKGDILVNENGMIGIISKVDKYTSEAELITNKNTFISVKINDSYGILYAKDNQLIVKDMKIEGEIKVGDEVVTSGLTSIPPNLKIGIVKEVKKDTLEIEYILDIEHASLQKIAYVGVIHL